MPGQTKKRKAAPKRKSAAKSTAPKTKVRTKTKSTAPKTKRKAVTKKVTKPKKTAKPKMKRVTDEAFRATSTRRPVGSAENKLVTFALEAPSGWSVSIAGSFNNWQPEAMVKGRGGVWRIAKRLAPGTYQYRFLVDTEWRADPKNPRMVENADGSHDSVCQVS